MFTDVISEITEVFELFFSSLTIFVILSFVNFSFFSNFLFVQKMDLLKKIAEIMEVSLKVTDG